MSKIDVSNYRSHFSCKEKLGRALWQLVWVLLFRTTPGCCCFGWRRFLLRCFGAKIGKGAHIYPSARIRAPWNLTMGDHSCLSFQVDCYCVDRIMIGVNATVSQYSFLCTASHDISDPGMKLTTAPISIGAGAWVAADVFIGPGVTIGEGAVCAARAVVVKDVEPWTVVAGNPTKAIKKRELRETEGQKGR